jgi:hypothetical protein
VAKGYFLKYLDQVNINNAFVSGMLVSDSRNFAPILLIEEQERGHGDVSK